MKRVAKALIIDSDDKYLLMYRSDHPTFGKDPDLPGGTLEDGESMLKTMVREVEEEIGVAVDPSFAIEAYSGTDYSAHGTHYALFIVHVDKRPDVTMSWEHSAYEWIDKSEFLQKAKNANDTYMHMVHDVVRQTKQ